jgi:fluoride exporter
MDSQIWLVGLGGFFGAITRYWVNQTFTKNRLFPLGTFIVNMTGSFLLGILIGNEWVPLSVGLLVGTGFLGAYTTFSTFHFELFLLKKDHRKILFFLYLTSSYFFGILLAGLGCWLCG